MSGSWQQAPRCRAISSSSDLVVAVRVDERLHRPTAPWCACGTSPGRPAPPGRRSRHHLVVLRLDGRSLSNITAVQRPALLVRSPGLQTRPASQPPDTGGRNATSSPSFSGVVMRAYSALTAHDTRPAVRRQRRVLLGSPCQRRPRVGAVRQLERAARLRRRSPAAGRTAAPSRACALQRRPPRRLRPSDRRSRLRSRRRRRRSARASRSARSA